MGGSGTTDNGSHVQTPPNDDDNTSPEPSQIPNSSTQSVAQRVAPSSGPLAQRAALTAELLAAEVLLKTKQAPVDDMEQKIRHAGWEFSLNECGTGMMRRMEEEILMIDGRIERLSPSERAAHRAQQVSMSVQSRFSNKYSTKLLLAPEYLYPHIPPSHPSLIAAYSLGV